MPKSVGVISPIKNQTPYARNTAKCASKIFYDDPSQQLEPSPNDSLSSEYELLIYFANNSSNNNNIGEPSYEKKFDMVTAPSIESGYGNDSWSCGEKSPDPNEKSGLNETIRKLQKRLADPIGLNDPVKRIRSNKECAKLLYCNESIQSSTGSNSDTDTANEGWVYNHNYKRPTLLSSDYTYHPKMPIYYKTTENHRSDKTYHKSFQSSKLQYIPVSGEIDSSDEEEHNQKNGKLEEFLHNISPETNMITLHSCGEGSSSKAKEEIGQRSRQFQ